MRAVLLATLGLFLLTGCLAHKVRVESEPPGATVIYAGKRRGVTPLEFTTLYTPHFRNDTQRHKVRVVLPEHRTVTFSIGRDVRLWRYVQFPLRSGWLQCLIPPFEWKNGACLQPRSERNVVLVADHGPSGTWNADDVP